MLALIFLLLGVVFLLAAAGRIWIDAPRLNSQTIDSAAANTADKSATLKKISDGRDSMHN